MVIKGGMIIASKMGDANASIPTTQPVFYQPMFAAHGKAKYASCLTFVSKAAMEENIKEKYGLEKTVVPVENCRNIGKERHGIQRQDTGDHGRSGNIRSKSRRSQHHIQTGEETSADTAV